MMTLDEALAAQQRALDDFAEICREGREQPVHLDRFVANRAAYLNASAAVYEGMWRSIRGTGVQIIGLGKT